LLTCSLVFFMDPCSSVLLNFFPNSSIFCFQLSLFLLTYCMLIIAFSEVSSLLTTESLSLCLSLSLSLPHSSLSLSTAPPSPSSSSIVLGLHARLIENMRGCSVPACVYLIHRVRLFQHPFIFWPPLQDSQSLLHIVCVLVGRAYSPCPRKRHILLSA
jgi:hypothetical protein